MDDAHGQQGTNSRILWLVALFIIQVGGGREAAPPANDGGRSTATLLLSTVTATTAPQIWTTTSLTEPATTHKRCGPEPSASPAYRLLVLLLR